MNMAEKTEHRCAECECFQEKLPESIVGYCKRWQHVLTKKSVGCLKREGCE